MHVGQEIGFLIRPRSVVHPAFFCILFGLRQRFHRVLKGQIRRRSSGEGAFANKGIELHGAGRMGLWLHHDLAKQPLLHALPVNFFLETVHVELEGMIERLLSRVVSLPIQRGKLLIHSGVDTAPQRLTGRMLHHRHHPLPCEFRGDAADVGLAFLQVLQPHVNGPFPDHVLNFQIQAGQQGSYHFPKILSGERNRHVARQLLPVCGEQLLFDLLGLSAVEIPNRGHDVDVKVTGFESSSTP